MVILSYSLKEQEQLFLKTKNFFAIWNDFENCHKREKRAFHVMNKEDLLKKISSCKNRIDNMTYTHFDLNLTSSHIFNIPVTSSYYSDNTLQLNV